MTVSLAAAWAAVTVVRPLWMALAPEPAANPLKTPNPSTNWHLLGPTEMLIYVEPWLAGVLVPALAWVLPWVIAGTWLTYWARARAGDR